MAYRICHVYPINVGTVYVGTIYVYTIHHLISLLRGDVSPMRLKERSFTNTVLYSKRIGHTSNLDLKGNHVDMSHWKVELLHRQGEQLLPKQLPIEVLIRIARCMAMYKDGALDRFEMEGIWNLLTFWIEKLLDAQHPDRLALFQKKHDALLPELVDELDLWIRMELVSRQIEYPIYSINITGLFENQFQQAFKGAK